MSTIHDLSEKISKIGIWDIVIVREIVVENVSTDSEIAVVKVVFS